MTNINFKKGIRFKCQGSSKCCVSRGKYGFVYLSNKDIGRLSAYKKLSKKDFIEFYCDKTDKYTHLKEVFKNGNCQFLEKKQCSVYEARPMQCRTWPFWSENLNTKIWNEEILKFCPGIGRGDIISSKEIEKNIKISNLNEKNILKEIK